jgi:tRNA(Ile)-lysidine synthase TilS/MesJ
MQCSKCHRDAIVFQSYSGMHLCGQHLVTDIEAKAKKMIRAQGWLRPGDHIAVLLTGNQSSSALLYFLKQLTSQRRDIQISAITIADTTSDNRDISRAKGIAEALGTEVFEGSLPESRILTGTDTEKSLNNASMPLFTPPRSILLDRMAQQHGITRIAWGLCLDDAAGVVLDGFIRGDMDRLVKGNSCKNTILRICPFISVTAEEVSLYATLCGFPDEQTPPPEPGDALHEDTVAMLEGYTGNHPATKYTLLNLGENLAGFSSGIAGLIQACEWYGEYLWGHSNDGSIENEVKNGSY